MVEQIQNTQPVAQPANPNPVQTASAQEGAKKSAPVGVKIISILYYIGAVVSLIGGLLMFLGENLFNSLFGIIGGFFASLFIVFGIVFVALAVLSFFIGRGLWKGQKWSRIVAIILTLLGFFGGIYALIQGTLINGIINVLIEGFIAGYLIFSPGVKQFFS